VNEPPHRAPIAGWFLSVAAENLGLKVTSLIIAMALFGLVRGAGSVQRSLEVSLLARLPPPAARRVLLTDLPDKVRVTVGGSPSLVANLRPDELGPVQIDLSDGRLPSVLLDSTLFNVPAGVQIVQVQPSSLQLTWDALVERDVPVRPELVGVPEAGTRLASSVELIPPTIRISGAALYVEALPAVRTDVIDITGLPPGRYERRVALDPPRRHVRYEFAGGVRVVFTIEREIAERRFDHLAVTPLGSARVMFRPPSVSVVVQGRAAVVGSVEASQIVPTAQVGDGSSLRGPARLGVEVSQLPSGISSVSVEPPEVIAIPQR
jgi:hypothetical protein